MPNADDLTPNPLVSNEQYRRFYCTDLDGLEDVELEDEFYYLRSHLLGLPQVCWPRERCLLLGEELKKRQGDTKFGTTRQPKPKLVSGVKL